MAADLSTIDLPRIADLVVARATATPDAEMACESSGARITFAEFAARVADVTAGLREELGISAGEIVSWSLPTGIDALVLSAALHCVGSIQNPIVPIYREREFTFCVRQTHADHLIVPDTWRGFDYAAMAERIGHETGVSVHVVSHGLPGAAGASIDLSRLADPSGPRWIFYTSGTTADPKGAIHRDEGLVAIADGLADRYDVGLGDRSAIAFPYTHIGGIVWLYLCLRHGATVLLDPVFDPVETTLFLAREGVTHAGSGTAFHLAFLEMQRRQPDTPLFPRLKLCPGGGAPKPPSLHAEVRAKLGGKGVVSGWGLTEAPILTTANHDDPDDKLAHTEGFAMPGVQLRVVTNDGRVAAPREEGELRAKGPQVMVSYVDATLNAAAFDDDGFVRTGDLGYLDEDGYVVITGRIKDVIIRHGENISAKEVEDVLFTHPLVRDVAVVGLPDDRTGERVCAVVALVEGSSGLSFDEMSDFVRAAGIRTQAIPEQLEIVDEIPRNEGGKALKTNLRDRFRSSSRRPPTLAPPTRPGLTEA